MKKFMLLAVIAAAISTTAMAQAPKEIDKEAMRKEHAEWDKKLKDELRMSPDQLAKYEALNKEYGDKMEALKNDASLDKDAQKQKKMELKKEKETKLFEFLTPEQQTKYKEMIEKKKKETEAVAKQQQ